MPVAVKTHMPSGRSMPCSPQSLTATGRRPVHRHLSLINPLSNQTPAWLMLLLTLRKISTPVMVLLLLGILPVYAWGVRMQQTWGETYQRLEQLRRDEHHFLSLNERRKYDLTQQVEYNPAGFVSKGPTNAIFMEPQPARLIRQATSEAMADAAEPVAPIGY